MQRIKDHWVRIRLIFAILLLSITMAGAVAPSIKTLADEGVPGGGHPYP